MRTIFGCSSGKAARAAFIEAFLSGHYLSKINTTYVSNGPFTIRFCRCYSSAFLKVRRNFVYLHFFQPLKFDLSACDCFFKFRLTLVRFLNGTGFSRQ